MGLLSKEIERIGYGGVGLFYEAKFTAVLDTGVDKLYPLLEVELDTHRNYVTNIADIVNITLVFPKGDYVLAIEPNRENLKVIITTYNIGFKSKSTYKLILTKTDIMTESKKDTNRDIGEMNKDALITLEGECIPEIIDKHKLSRLQSIFKDSTVDGVINETIGLLTNTFSSLGGLGNQLFRMTPADNQRVYDQIILKEGMSILDVPSFLQNTNYGVYNGGIGTYIQKKDKDEITYVYPIYGNKEKIYDKNLILVDAANSMSMQNDITYSIEDTSIRVVCSMFTAEEPNDENSIKEMGTGLIAVESDSVMKRSSEISEDKINIKKENYTREMVKRKLSDGSANTRSVGVTNNMYKHRSSVVGSDGNLVTFKWINSNADILMPGMDVIHLFEENNSVSKRYGSLHGVTKIIDNNSKKETTILLIFIKNNEN